MDLTVPDWVPEDVAARLEELRKEWEEGDITEKGYKKHRDQILSTCVAMTPSSRTTSETNNSPFVRPPSPAMSQMSSPSGRKEDDEISIFSGQPRFAYGPTDGNNQPGGTATGAVLPNVKLQKPLDPRGIPDSAKAQHLAKFDSLPWILRHRGMTGSKSSIAFTVLDTKGKELNSISWEKLASRAEKVAQMIRDKSGLYRGDRIVLLYQDLEVVEFIVALLGCLVAGVVAVPLSASSRIRDLEYVLSSTQSHLVLSTETNVKSIQKLLSQTNQNWPRGVEFWKTNEFGSYHPPKKNAELPALQVPDLAYIEFARSPLGELRGVVMSNRTILHQMNCLTAMLKKGTATTRETVLVNVDMRQSIGLIIGVLMAVFTGNHTIYLPQQAMATGGLYAHVISKYRASILLSDYPSLKQVAYNYQAHPHITRNYSKKYKVDFSSVKWVLVDAVTVDAEFHEVLADRWLKPLGNKRARDAVSPMLTLSEHGGMILSMRDFLGGQEKMGCNLGQGVGASADDEAIEDVNELLVSTAGLANNHIQIEGTAPSRTSISQESEKYIRIGGFGYPLPDATLAIVDPETCILTPEMTVGEIWIDSPSLSGGFWGLARETDGIFRATCFNENGPIDTEFLRTGLLGFIFNGKVYILGLYEDRLRQKRLETSNEKQPTSPATYASSVYASENEKEDQQAVMAPTSPYTYYYAAHLVQTIVRQVERVFDCAVFDIFVNGEYLPIVVAETTLAQLVSATPGVPASQGSTGIGINATGSAAELNAVATRIMDILEKRHKLRVFCILMTPTDTLPRITRSGRSEIGNMLCKRRFDLGALPAAFVKFGSAQELGRLEPSYPVTAATPLPTTGDGVWTEGAGEARQVTLSNEDKQYSGVDFRDVVVDERTAAPLTSFDSIVHLLQWRVSHQAEELAFSTIDARGKEGKGLAWKKLDQRIGSVAQMIKSKIKARPGETLILMYTQSEDYVVAIYACLVLGVVPMALPPIDSNRLNEDIPALLGLCKEYKVHALLTNADVEDIFKSKPVAQHIKQTASILRYSLPSHYNTSKVKTVNGASSKDFQMQPKWFQESFAAIVWVYFNADHRPTLVQLNHASVLNMCKIQKETCQMISTRPVMACVRSTTGVGFLHTCFMGAYLGASTLILSPMDYANSPATLFITLSRLRVKDSYATQQMLEHACAVYRPKGFSLADTKNIMVTSDGRPPTDLVKKVRISFGSTGLESTAIALGYSHYLNPLIATRSYMSTEPIDLWLDPIALRQGYVSVVNPENFPSALHLHDSGMVPVSTQIAIVNPETCKLCRIGEYGEIWVYSEGSVASYFGSKDKFIAEQLQGRILDGDPEVLYVRTGDLGFLHTVRKSGAGAGGAVGAGANSMIEMQTLFVLGQIGDTFEVNGLCHFPMDIETSIERSHKSISGAVTFQAGGMVVVVVEVEAGASLRGGSLAALVPVVVTSVLQDHQLIVNIVAFVTKGGLARSRLGEKQRGRILQQWVSKRLNVVAKYGVSAGDN